MDRLQDGVCEKRIALYLEYSMTYSPGPAAWRYSEAASLIIVVYMNSPHISIRFTAPCTIDRV